MGWRFLPAMLANHIGGVAGYAAVLFLVAIEHHAGEMEVFTDPGPDETHDEYYRRQIRSTCNFLRSPALDSALMRILEEEVPFENRRTSGSSTAAWTHTSSTTCSPTCRRTGSVRWRCSSGDRHPIRPALPRDTAGDGGADAENPDGTVDPGGRTRSRSPAGATEAPAGLARRLGSGLRYRTLPDAPYLDKTRWHNVPVPGGRHRAAGEGRRG